MLSHLKTDHINDGEAVQPLWWFTGTCCIYEWVLFSQIYTDPVNWKSPTCAKPIVRSRWWQDGLEKVALVLCSSQKQRSPLKCQTHTDFLTKGNFNAPKGKHSNNCHHKQHHQPRSHSSYCSRQTRCRKGRQVSQRSHNWRWLKQHRQCECERPLVNLGKAHPCIATVRFLVHCGLLPWETVFPEWIDPCTCKPASCCRVFFPSFKCRPKASSIRIDPHSSIGLEHVGYRIFPVQDGRSFLSWPLHNWSLEIIEVIGKALSMVTSHLWWISGSDFSSITRTGSAALTLWSNGDILAGIGAHTRKISKKETWKWMTGSYWSISQILTSGFLMRNILWVVFFSHSVKTLGAHSQHWLVSCQALPDRVRKVVRSFFSAFDGIFRIFTPHEFEKNTHGTVPFRGKRTAMNVNRGFENLRWVRWASESEHGDV